MYQSVQDDYKSSTNLNPLDPRQRRMMKPKSESRLTNDLSLNSKNDNVFDRLTKIDAGMEKYKEILKNSEKSINVCDQSKKSNKDLGMYGNNNTSSQKKVRVLKKKPARDVKNIKALPNIRKRYGKLRNKENSHKKMSMINIESKDGLLDNDKKEILSPYDMIKEDRNKKNKDDQNSSFLDLPESDTKFGQRDENSYSSDEDFDEFDILKLPKSNR